MILFALLWLALIVIGIATFYRGWDIEVPLTEEDLEKPRCKPSNLPLDESNEGQDA